MLTKEAKDTQNFCVRRVFFNSARSAFKCLLKSILTADDIILMPAYIGQSAKEGSGVFDPIRETQSKYLFYKILPDLSVDLNDLKEKIALQNVKAVLIIHYFGFGQRDIFKIKQLCKEKGVYLIEDCAHTLESTLDGHLLGTIGDFSFHSIHKLIATDDGGILNINCPDITISSDEQISFKTLLQFVNTQVGQTSEKRRQNYQRYLDLLPSQGKYYQIMYTELPDGVVPLNFPILIKGYPREKYYYDLIDRGVITVSLYYQMIDELDKKMYPISFDISEHILNLPVHQDITEEDIQKVVKEIKELEKI